MDDPHDPWKLINEARLELAHLVSCFERRTGKTANPKVVEAVWKDFYIPYLRGDSGKPPEDGVDARLEVRQQDYHS